MVFVKDERYYTDLSNKQIEERKRKLKNKIDNLEKDVHIIQRRVKKYHI